MATNEILQFCATDTKSNLLTQSEYEADGERIIGNQPGIARSKFVNKVLRQTSAVAAGLGEFIKNGGNDCTDAQAPAVIASGIENSVVKFGRPPIASAEGTADAIYATFNTDIHFTDGEQIIVRAAMANTGAATLAVGIDGTAKNIYKDNNVALIAGDIAGLGHWLELAFDATLDKWCLLNPKQPEHIDRAAVVDIVYPVGSVFITFDGGAVPSVLFPNTTWERIKSGLFLQAESLSARMGLEIAAGLPNITASVDAHERPCWRAFSGAFYETSKAAGVAAYASFSSNPLNWAMSASRSNAIYGNSDTVQPPAICCAMWKRTA